MSVDVAKLEAAADAAAEKARKAREAHDAAMTERAERNTARREAFWQNAPEKAAAEHVRLRDAKDAVVAAIREGHGPEALTAYLAYARTHHEVAAFTKAAERASRRTVNPGRIDERQVSAVRGLTGVPVSFETLLTEAIKGAAWGRDYLADVLRPLSAELEVEG